MSVSAEIRKCAASQNTAPPRHLGTRYRADRFLPQPGNTVVCHLNHDDPAHQAVMTARARIHDLAGPDRLLFTPASSLHMTVFEGVIEPRRTPDTWPAEISPDAPVETVTDWLTPRLRAFEPPPPFQVAVAGLRPSGLILKGATPQDDRLMQDWRAALTVPFGYRHKDHDQYRFHMTFAYPVDWIPDADVPEWEDAFQDILSDLIRDMPILPLHPPTFCRFADMTGFEELVSLAS